MTADISDLIRAGRSQARFAFGLEGASEAADAVLADATGAFGEAGAGDAVAAILTNDRPTVGLVLAAIESGSRLVSLPLPPRAADLERYADVLRQACARHGVERVVVRDDVADLLEMIGIPALPHRELGTRPLAGPTGHGFELVQFSSGSTGVPKGIVLDTATLAANVEAMLACVRPRPGDATVSWLPLSHDLGLVAMLLTSIAAGAPEHVGPGDIVILTPESFLASPAVWLEALHAWRGTFTAAPDFAFRLASRRRVRDGLDLRHVRCAVVGGEIVRATSLDAFLATTAAAGFPSGALCPAYGMAELGVAVTVTPPEDPWRTRDVSTTALSEGLVAPAGPDEPSTRLVASGPPLDRYGVAVDAEPGALGTISVTAPAAGTDVATGTPFTDGEGRFVTADSGFVEDGWLYCCGRLDDHIVAGGRNLYAPAVEDAVGGLDDVRPGRVTAFSVPTGEWIVAVEASAAVAADPGRLEQGIRRASVGAASASPDHVVVLPPGQLPMTSSGKVQRHELRRRWLTGQIQGAG